MHVSGLLCLSRLCLNLQSAPARRDILDPYQMHRTLLQSCDVERLTAGMLHRVEMGTSEAIVLVQSCQGPDWSRLPEDYLAEEARTPNPAVTYWTPQFAPGQVLRFRLRANPTFKRGRRRLAWLREEEQQAWLERQAARCGFAVLQAWPVSEGFVHMARPGLHRCVLTSYSVLFDGFISVADPALLATAVAAGIGSAKAFGFGLLSLALPEGPVGP